MWSIALASAFTRVAEVQDDFPSSASCKEVVCVMLTPTGLCMTDDTAMLERKRFQSAQPPETMLML